MKCQQNLNSVGAINHKRGIARRPTKSNSGNTNRYEISSRPLCRNCSDLWGSTGHQASHRGAAKHGICFVSRLVPSNVNSYTLPSVCAISRAPARSIRIGHRQLRIPPPYSGGFRSKSLATGSRFATNLAISKPRTTVDENRNRRAVAIPAQTGLHKRRMCEPNQVSKG